MKPKKLKITIKRFPNGSVTIGLNRTLITRKEEQRFMDIINKKDTKENKKKGAICVIPNTNTI